NDALQRPASLCLLPQQQQLQGLAWISSSSREAEMPFSKYEDETASPKPNKSSKMPNTQAREPLGMCGEHLTSLSHFTAQARDANVFNGKLITSCKLTSTFTGSSPGKKTKKMKGEREGGKKGRRKGGGGRREEGWKERERKAADRTREANGKQAEERTNKEGQNRERRQAKEKKGIPKEGRKEKKRKERKKKKERKEKARKKKGRKEGKKKKKKEKKARRKEGRRERKKKERKKEKKKERKEGTRKLDLQTQNEPWTKPDLPRSQAKKLAPERDK
ncbi:hypothetical protein E2320_012038, partial [Naja naja]